MQRHSPVIFMTFLASVLFLGTKIGLAHAGIVSNTPVLVYETPNIFTQISSISIEILLVLGGVMAAIAIMVLLRSRK